MIFQVEYDYPPLAEPGMYHLKVVQIDDILYKGEARKVWARFITPNLHMHEEVFDMSDSDDVITLARIAALISPEAAVRNGNVVTVDTTKMLGGYFYADIEPSERKGLAITAPKKSRRRQDPTASWTFTRQKTEVKER